MVFLFFLAAFFSLLSAKFSFFRLLNPSSISSPVVFGYGTGLTVGAWELIGKGDTFGRDSVRAFGRRIRSCYIVSVIQPVPGFRHTGVWKIFVRRSRGRKI